MPYTAPTCGYAGNPQLEPPNKRIMAKQTNFLIALSIGLFLLLLTQNNVTAQQTGSMINWEALELTGPDAKLAPRSFRWWYLSPLAVTPIFFLDSDEPAEPAPTPSPQIQCLPDQDLAWGTPLPAATPGDLQVTIFCSDPEYTVTLEAETSNGSSGCSGDPLIVTRTYRVTDACGEVARCRQRFIYAVDDTPPALTCPANLTVDCGSDLSPEVTGSPGATDDRTPTGELAITYTDDDSGLTACGPTGIIIRTWTATDACGNSSSCVQEITVQDTQAPTITCPPNTFFACNQPFSPDLTGWAEATDQCAADAVVLEYRDDVSNLQDCSGFVERIWLATDPCGNVAECIQRLTVIPTACDYQPDITVMPANCSQTDGSVALAGIPDHFTIVWSNGTTGPVVENLPVGEVEAVIIEADSSCSQLLTITIDSGPPFPFDVTATQPPSAPEGNDGFITLFVPGPLGVAPFTLLVNGIPLAEFSGEEYTLNDLTAGAYQLQLIDANGCPFMETTVTLQDPPSVTAPVWHIRTVPAPPIPTFGGSPPTTPSSIEHALPEGGWAATPITTGGLTPGVAFTYRRYWQFQLMVGQQPGYWVHQHPAYTAVIPYIYDFADGNAQFVLPGRTIQPYAGVGITRQSYRWQDGQLYSNTAVEQFPAAGEEQSWYPYLQTGLQLSWSKHLRLQLGLRQVWSESEGGSLDLGVQVSRALGVN